MQEERQGGLSLLYTEKGNAKLLSSEETSKGNRAKNCFIDLCQARWRSGEEATCNAGDPRVAGFDPWVRKIPWSWKWQPTPVFLPGKSSWTEEPDRLQSTGSRRVEYDWATEQQQTFQRRGWILLNPGNRVWGRNIFPTLASGRKVISWNIPTSQN